MVFAKRPDNGLERPYRSLLADLSKIPDARLRRRRVVLIVTLCLAVPVLVAGCIGLGSNLHQLGPFTLAASGMLLGLIFGVQSIGGLVRVAHEFSIRRWQANLEARAHPDRADWPEGE